MVIGFTSVEPKGEVMAGGRKFTVVHIERVYLEKV